MAANLQTIWATSLKIPINAVAPLIGARGWRIEEIKASTNTIINIGNDKDADGNIECKIKGKGSLNVDQAKAQIIKFLEDFSNGKISGRPDKTTVQNKIRKAHGATETVSLSVILKEGGPPVEVKAIPDGHGRFRCPRCDTTFGKSNLRDRLTKHAKTCYIDAEGNSISKDLKVKLKVSNSEWTCQYCWKEFDNQKSLAQHSGTQCDKSTA